MQQPHLIFNWSAIATAVIAAFFFGFLWYGPLFGKSWGKLMGINMNQKPDGKVMAKAFLLQVLGLFLMTYVVAHSVQIWRPSVWGAGQDGSDATYGFFCGFFNWLGFLVPLQFGKVSWENRPWKLFFINTGHDFLNLQIISQILAHWR